MSSQQLFLFRSYSSAKVRPSNTFARSIHPLARFQFGQPTGNLTLFNHVPLALQQVSSLKRYSHDQ